MGFGERRVEKKLLIGGWNWKPNLIVLRFLGALVFLHSDIFNSQFVDTQLLMIITLMISIPRHQKSKIRDDR